MREGWIYKTFRDYLDKVGVYMVVCWFLKIKKKRKRTNGHQSYIETELTRLGIFRKGTSDPIFYLPI